MKLLKKIGIYIYLGFLGIFVSFMSVYAQGRFEDSVLKTQGDGSVVESTIGNMNYNTTPYYGANNIGNFIIDFLVKYIVPLFLVVGVMVTIFGFYKLMMSNKDGDTSKGMDYIIWGVVGIIVIQSASFLAGTYVNILTDTLDNNLSAVQLNSLPEQIYNSLVFPFIQMLMYIVIGVLFITLLINVIKFISSPDDKIVTHSKNIIVNNIIGIVVIMLAKEIVQFIYGKQETLKSGSSSLGDIGTGVLTTSNIKLIYDIINRGLSIISFIILVIIIYQSYQLLINPTDEKQLSNIRRNFLYIFIGLVIIGFAYLIVNLLLVN